MGRATLCVFRLVSFHADTNKHVYVYVAYIILYLSVYIYKHVRRCVSHFYAVSFFMFIVTSHP